MRDYQVQEFPKTRARRLLLASLVVVGMGFSVLFPVLAPLGREIGLSELQITSIISASSLTVFLSSPQWGRASDRWGRKRVMLIGLFGFSVGTTLFNSVLYAGFVGMLSGGVLWATLVVARVMHACVMSATMPAANAYMADLTSTTQRTKGMGAAGASTNVGTILGPAVSGLAVISLLTPLWVMAALALLNGLFVLRFLPDLPRQRPSVRPGRMKYTDRRILSFVIVGVVMFVGFALVQQTIGFRFQDVLGLSAGQTAQTYGLGMTLSASCALFAQGFIVQRFHLQPFTLLRSALPLLIISFLTMAIADARWQLYGGMMFLGLGMGLGVPGFMAGASLSVPPEEQGAVAGVASACGPLGFFIGPLAGGGLYQLNPVLPYLFSAGMYVILLGCMHWIRRGVAVHSVEDDPASQMASS